ncbi:hypothetical protein HanIR_Chr15g0772871 [Helianthus annuus]|nr:hypothetical protein HanIR_Chr15g0772871 [Helianthus annuus]
MNRFVKNLAAIKNQIEAQMTEVLQSIQSMGTDSNHGHSNGNSYNSFNNRLTKMDFPKFNGDNLEGWLCRVEHFFAIDETPGHMKIRI